MPTNHRKKRTKPIQIFMPVDIISRPAEDDMFPDWKSYGTGFIHRDGRGFTVIPAEEDYRIVARKEVKPRRRKRPEDTYRFDL